MSFLVLRLIDTIAGRTAVASWYCCQSRHPRHVSSTNY